MTAADGPDRTGGEACRKMLIRTATDTGYWLWCPACDDAHRISDGWAWNGDTERPTFTPSIRVGGVQWAEDQDFYKPSHSKVPAGGQIVCHSFLTDGVWHYLGDCTHDKAGQSVPMVALPDWMESDRG